MILDVPRDRLPDIDFARIRPYGQPASRPSAFEELASILIEQGVQVLSSGLTVFAFIDSAIRMADAKARGSC